MRKTLKLIEKYYTLLEQDVPPLEMGNAAATPPPEMGQDPTMPEPGAKSEVKRLTSQQEVNLIRGAINLVQSVLRSKPDENTESMILNFDADNIDDQNAQDEFKKFQQILGSNVRDTEVSNIDNKYEL
jgi:hypothetical protein